MTAVVIDASAGVEMVAGTRRGAALAKLLPAEAEGWVPEHFYAEVVAAAVSGSRAVWHSVCHNPGMASRVVRARLDEESERALSILMLEGRNESEAVRTALLEAGRRRAQRSALAAEVSRLAADPVDTAERRAVMADMDAVAADWPE